MKSSPHPHPFSRQLFRRSLGLLLALLFLGSRSWILHREQVLMLSPDERLQESHRHFSHLMAIHPLRLLNYEEHRKIIDAGILDLERLGTGYWVGYTYTWMAELFAIQRNGSGAAHYLKTFWEDFCSQNGFHLNGDYRRKGHGIFHYRPFTLEGNFCAADALQEMLLHTENGVLDFFPAIPPEWEEQVLSFRTLRAEKGLLVSASLDHGVLQHVTLIAKFTGTVKVRNTRGAALLKTTVAVVEETPAYLILQLAKGLPVTADRRTHG